jgi:hypothetical protein
LVESIVVIFLQALVLVPITLLPIINPLGTAPVFVAEFGANRTVAQRLARQIAINSWFVMLASMLIGTHILALFGNLPRAINQRNAPMPSMGRAAAEILKRKPKMATSQIVEVVPSVAPMIIPTACEKVTSPALTKPMTVRIAAVED